MSNAGRNDRDTALGPYNSRTGPVQPGGKACGTPYDAGDVRPSGLVSGAPPAHAGTVTHQQTTDELDEPRIPARQLSLCFSSTRRGARLARQLAVQQLTEWTGLPYDSGAARTVALVTAELASNAIAHGSLPGRDFRLTLLLLPEPAAAVRIEATDTRPERRPPQPATEPAPQADATSGRGLLLVQAHAHRWGCTVRDAYAKTVWAEVPLQPPNASPPSRTG